MNIKTISRNEYEFKCAFFQKRIDGVKSAQQKIALEIIDLSSGPISRETFFYDMGRAALLAAGFSSAQLVVDSINAEFEAWENSVQTAEFVNHE